MLIIIMEEALLNALNTDNQIRTTAECYLRNIESSPGFLWALFQIYLNNIDSKTIIISCNNITTYIGIEILQIINTDPKCFTALNSSYCKQCISNTYILNGICSCIENSQYSDITKTCECNNGLSLINGYCIGCENYYQNSELSGIFSNDFKSIIITFARQAVINYQDSCKTLLILPNYLLILSPTCI